MVTVHSLSSVDLWGEEMLNHLNKLRNVLLQSEDHSVGPCIKCVGHLDENKQTVTVI